MRRHKVGCRTEKEAGGVRDREGGGEKRHSILVDSISDSGSNIFIANFSDSRSNFSLGRCDKAHRGRTQPDHLEQRLMLPPRLAPTARIASFSNYHCIPKLKITTKLFRRVCLPRRGMCS